MPAIKFLDSVLCDICSNCQRGVKIPGRFICLDCAGDDIELTKEIVRIAMPETAQRLEQAIAKGLK